MLVALGSPNAGGVSDRLGMLFAGDSGASVVAVRDLRVSPCRGCQLCLHSGRCVYPPDGADAFFERLLHVEKAVFAAPIYFYALPGQFKMLIDRSQPFWSRLHRPPSGKKAAIVLAAGRKRGEKLFEGAFLTLRWFLEPFGFRITEKLFLRGLESVADIGGEVEEQIRGASARFAAC